MQTDAGKGDFSREVSGFDVNNFPFLEVKVIKPAGSLLETDAFILFFESIRASFMGIGNIEFRTAAGLITFTFP